MMEKYDGVRVYWDGARLRQANGTKNIIDVSKIRDKLPTIPFEGELW
jgi:hypothetical protein